MGRDTPSNTTGAAQSRLTTQQVRCSGIGFIVRMGPGEDHGMDESEEDGGFEGDGAAAEE